VVRGAAHHASGARIGVDDVERALERIAGSSSRRNPGAAASLPRPEQGVPSARGSLHAATFQLRRQMLIDALAAAGGNQTLAGVMLGLHERNDGVESGGAARLDLRARKLAQRKFRYWWDRLVASAVPLAADDSPGDPAVAITPTDVAVGGLE